MSRVFVCLSWLALKIFPFLRNLIPDALSRERLAARYLFGTGIEIGALHNPLRVPPCVRVKYVDRLPVPELRKQYPEFKKLKLVEPDIIDDGETLQTIADASHDFVIANHFLEHCQNPLLALQNMVRVLRVDGVLFFSVPDMRASFDKDRPLTPLAHIERDYREGPAWSRQAAFEEYVKLVDKITDHEKWRHQVDFYMKINYSIHYHVWTEWEILEMLGYLKRNLLLPVRLELLHHHGAEIICVLRKT